MNKSMLMGTVAGIGLAAAGAVMAAYAMRSDSPEQEVVAQEAIESISEQESAGAVAELAVEADVPAAQAATEVAATPVVAATAPPAAKAKPKAKTKPTTAPVATVAQAPKEECWDEVVTHTADPKDDHRIAGTVIGGVVGAAIGHQFGGGSGKTLATVAGAAGGAYAGNRAQKAVQEDNTYTTTERRCKPVE